MKHSVFIADDHPLTLLGTKTFVESLGFRVVETASNGITALNAILRLKPDVAILDINMPGMNGLEIMVKLVEEQVETKVVLLTMHKETSVYLKAKSLNVKGYVLKEHAFEELTACINTVIAGKEYVSPKLLTGLVIDDETTQTDQTNLDKLTPAEKKILRLIAEQKNSKEIAELLFISERTVENHRRSIIQKLNLPKEKNVLLIWALQHLR